MINTEIYNYVPHKEKVTLIAQECLGFPVQRYNLNYEGLFQDQKFNGCVAFVRFVLINSGIPIPDFITPSGEQFPLRHVNEFYDHFGINIPFGKQQPGDLVFFSWNGEIPQHIGIVFNETSYIHAHTKDGQVKKNSLKQNPINRATQDSRFMNNPIGFKRPTLAIKDNKRWFQKEI